MRETTRAKLDFYRALLVESFEKDDAVGYETAVRGLRRLIPDSKLNRTHKRELVVRRKYGIPIFTEEMFDR